MPVPTPPTSPDELKPAIHGKVGGVTRIGRKAIAAGALVAGLLLVLILYGAQHSGKPTVTVDNTIPSAPPVEASSMAGQHFGENEPIALPKPSPTIPPPLALGSVVPAAPAAGGPAPGAPSTSVAAPEPTLAPQTAVPQTPAPQAPAAVLPAGPTAAQIAAERRATEARAAQLAREQLAGTAARAPIVLAQNESLPGSAAGGAAAAGTPQPAPAGSAGNANGFLNGPTGQLANGGADRPVVSDRVAPASPYEVIAGSIIPAILLTAVNSQNPGLITGQVREDVYDSLTGRYLLVPRGSRLIGVYKNDLANGQSRLLVAWKRLIFPDTSAIDLVNMSGADVEGAAGFEGKVDTHFGKILGQTLLASILTAGLQLSQPPQQTSTNGSTTVVSPGQVAAGAIGQSVAQTVTNQLQATSMIPPTVYIPRGYPFVVIVDRDLVLNAPYRS